MCQVSHRAGVCPCLTALRRYLCHLPHPRPPEPPENQFSAAGCYRPDQGAPASCRQITHCLLLPPHCLPPVPASPLWEMVLPGVRPHCESGSLRLPGDRPGTELLLQVPGALYGLWATF